MHTGIAYYLKQAQNKLIRKYVIAFNAKPVLSDIIEK